MSDNFTPYGLRARDQIYVSIKAMLRSWQPFFARTGEINLPWHKDKKVGQKQIGSLISEETG